MCSQGVLACHVTTVSRLLTTEATPPAATSGEIKAKPARRAKKHVVSEFVKQRSAYREQVHALRKTYAESVRAQQQVGGNRAIPGFVN